MRRSCPALDEEEAYSRIVFDVEGELARYASPEPLLRPFGDEHEHPPFFIDSIDALLVFVDSLRTIQPYNRGKEDHERRSKSLPSAEAEKRRPPTRSQRPQALQGALPSVHMTDPSDLSSEDAVGENRMGKRPRKLTEVDASFSISSPPPQPSRLPSPPRHSNAPTTFTFSPLSLATAPLSPPTADDAAQATCASFLRALNQKVLQRYHQDVSPRVETQQLSHTTTKRAAVRGSNAGKRKRERSFWAELEQKRQQEAKAEEQQRNKGKERVDNILASTAAVTANLEIRGRPSPTYMPTDLVETDHGDMRIIGGAASMSIPMSDHHMRLIAQGTELLLAFDRLMWLFTPLHPAIIHEDNLKLALSSRHDEYECLTDPVLLHVHTALAFGAFLLEARDLAEEFYQRARRQLEYLCDSHDYSVAEALWCLAYFHLGKGNTNQCTYYTTMALQMGQTLGAYNSFLYGKCLVSAVLNPDFTLAEKTRLVNDYVAKVEDMPLHYDKQRAALIENSTLLSFGTKRGQGMSTLLILDKAKIIEKLICECLLLHACYTQPSDKHTEEEKDRIARDNALILSKYAQALATFRQELQTSADKFVDGFATSMVLAWIALNVQYYELAANPRLALYWSLQFADKAKRLAIDLCGPSVIRAYEIVINFLMSAERVDVVQHILELPKLSQWGSVFPLCETRLRELSSMLAREKRKRSTTASSSSSSSSLREGKASPPSKSSSPSSAYTSSPSSGGSSPSSRDTVSDEDMSWLTFLN